MHRRRRRQRSAFRISSPRRPRSPRRRARHRRRRPPIRRPRRRRPRRKSPRWSLFRPSRKRRRSRSRSPSRSTTRSRSSPRKPEPPKVEKPPDPKPEPKPEVKKPEPKPPVAPPPKPQPKKGRRRQHRRQHPEERRQEPADQDAAAVAAATQGDHAASSRRSPACHGRDRQRDRRRAGQDPAVLEPDAGRPGGTGRVVGRADEPGRHAGQSGVHGLGPPQRSRLLRDGRSGAARAAQPRVASPGPCRSIVTPAGAPSPSTSIHATTD